MEISRKTFQFFAIFFECENLCTLFSYSINMTKFELIWSFSFMEQKLLISEESSSKYITVIIHNP